MVRDLVDAHCVQPQTGLGGVDLRRRLVARIRQEPAVYEFICEFDLLYHGNNILVFFFNLAIYQSSPERTNVGIRYLFAQGKAS